MKIHTIIVDDEPLARRRLKTFLKADPEIELISECADGFEAVRAIKRHSPDLVFLDVQMPEKDGFGVIADLQGSRLPLFIFVTAYDEYALKAFEVAALDYLLKPFDEARFQKTLQRAKAVLDGSSADQTSVLLEFLKEWKSRPKYLEKIAVSSEDRIWLLPVDRIEFIEASGNYLRIHAGKNAYVLRETVQSIERQLDPAKFWRVHRSVIVNVDRIREIKQMFHGSFRIVLLSGRELPLSRKYKHLIPRIATREA
jgi:two-component system, LytTR family, response regulator